VQVFYLWSKWTDNIHSINHTSNDDNLTESIQVDMSYHKSKR
jgi:hypothetical protein